MPTLLARSAAEAAAVVRPTDSIAIGLGPAHPGAFLHALGERDDWTDLRVFGALLTDLYAVFTKPNVSYRSGFFGPAERFLRDSGAAIEYVPADFRRFGPIVQRINPRVMATSCAPPDADGYHAWEENPNAGVDPFGVGPDGFADGTGSESASSEGSGGCSTVSGAGVAGMLVGLVGLLGRRR